MQSKTLRQVNQWWRPLLSYRVERITASVTAESKPEQWEISQSLSTNIGVPRSIETIYEPLVMVVQVGGHLSIVADDTQGIDLLEGVDEMAATLAFCTECLVYHHPSLAFGFVVAL